jgi:hypothetical protein
MLDTCGLADMGLPSSPPTRPCNHRMSLVDMSHVCFAIQCRKLKHSVGFSFLGFACVKLYFDSRYILYGGLVVWRSYLVNMFWLNWKLIRFANKSTVSQRLGLCHPVNRIKRMPWSRWQCLLITVWKMEWWGSGDRDGADFTWRLAWELSIGVYMPRFTQDWSSSPITLSYQAKNPNSYSTGTCWVVYVKFIIP